MTEEELDIAVMACDKIIENIAILATADYACRDCKYVNLDENYEDLQNKFIDHRQALICSFVETVVQRIEDKYKEQKK